MALNTWVGNNAACDRCGKEAKDGDPMINFERTARHYSDRAIMGFHLSCLNKIVRKLTEGDKPNAD